jgi:LysM domain
MTTRLKLFFLSFCIVLIPMLFSCASAVQQHKEDAVPPAAAAPVPAAEPAAIEPAPAAPESAPTATAPAVETAPAAIETEIMEPAPAPEELHPYIIKKGDTLWDISNTFLKDPFLWPFIWKANPTITNPDLIFTGNTLMIPSLSPIERALLAAKEPVVEKKEAASVKEPAPLREAGIAGAHVTSPKAEAEETPAGSRLILPEEQIYPIIDRFSMLSAGFVNEEETEDIITGAPEKGKSIFGYDDVVYVSMRDAGNVKIGEKFLIYTHVHNVRHPKTRKNFGKLIKGLGILQITAKDPAADVLTARITLSFDAIEKGNMLTPYEEPVPVYNSSQKKAKDISGYILEVTDRRTINAQTDVVYIDRGKADGVEAGDRFVVYEEPVKRGFPRKVIGEVQVMLVKEHTSTAVVGKSAEPMGKGSPVNFKQ